jgi:hypothetical protein
MPRKRPPAFTSEEKVSIAARVFTNLAAKMKPPKPQKQKPIAVALDTAKLLKNLPKDLKSFLYPDAPPPPSARPQTFEERKIQELNGVMERLERKQAAQRNGGRFAMSYVQKFRRLGD